MIGVGVKNSTSDLLIANCDEFIYYDDLVRVAPKKKGGGDPEEDRSQGGGGARGNSDGDGET